MKLNTGKVLNLFCAGAPPSRIAERLDASTKDVKETMRKLLKDRNTIGLYTPYDRESRQGMRITQNEWLLIKSHKALDIPPEVTAMMLQRKVKEFHSELNQDVREAWADMKRTGTGVDLCLAYRYCYYVKNISIIPDKAYDELEAEEREFGANSQVLETVGSDNAEDYPPHIRALGMYLLFKYAERKGKE